MPKNSWIYKAVVRTPKTYYFDNTNGSDNSPNTGGSPDSPFKTITKLNTIRLYPGDRVLFKCGETFAGMITPLGVGTAQNRIYFGSYGTGARPIIDGSAQAHSVAITSTAQYGYVFEGLDLSGATGANMEVVRIFSHDVSLINCLVHGSASYMGIGCWSTTGGEIYNILISGCTVYSNNYSGMYIGADTYTLGPRNCMVEYCTFYSNGSRTGYDHGCYVSGDTTVRFCESYSNNTSGFKLNDEGNSIYGFYPKIYSCYSHNNVEEGIIAVHKGPLKIYNNLCINNTRDGICMDNRATYAEVYHNTLVNNGRNCLKLLNNSADEDASKTYNIFKSNCLVQQDTGSWGTYTMSYGAIIGAPSGSAAFLAKYNTFDYNGYLGINGICGLTFANWKALTGSPDVNSFQTTALADFVTRWTDLHIATNTGNLYAKGIALTAYQFDKDNKPWNTGTNPSIGCYEYVA